MTKENTVNFYDNESSQYSKKRYEGETLTYFQFLFKRRRKIFLDFVSLVSSKLVSAKAYEIGCADGVIVKKLLQKHSASFSSIVGVDVSPKMLEQARETTTDKRASYFIRGEEPKSSYDLIMELGVHAADFEEEMVYVSERLITGGYFVHSVAGIGSLHARIKLRGKDYVNDYLSYVEYEKIIKKYFEILSSESYGLFIPKLWAFPGLARVVQPIADKIFKNIFPELFHEKIYLLRKK